MAYLQALINRHQGSGMVARAAASYVPPPMYAPAPEPEPPAPPPAPKVGRPPIGRALGRIGGVGKSQTRMPSQLPPGTHMRVGAGKTPVVSPQVAALMDTYSSLDDIQNQVSALRRVASLYARGFTKSNQTKVVIPPNYQGAAYSAGAVTPNPAAIVSSGAGSNLVSPAALENEAQGEMVGKSGPNPLQKMATDVAVASAPMEAPPVARTARFANQHISAPAAGFTADSTPATAFAQQIGAEVTVENAPLAQPSFAAASAGMATMFSKGPRSAMRKQ